MYDERHLRPFENSSIEILIAGLWAETSDQHLLAREHYFKVTMG